MTDLEDLRRLKRPALLALATKLQLSPKKNISNDELAKLVYDCQQPDQNREEQNMRSDIMEEPKLNERGNSDEIEETLQEIATHFGADVLEVGQMEHGETIFSVKKKGGKEYARGTYPELVIALNESRARQVAENSTPPTALNASDLSVGYEAEHGVPPPPATAEHVQLVEAGLVTLKKLGLNAVIETDSVRLTYGGRTLTTTIHQPVHRIVKTAEQLVMRK